MPEIPLSKGYVALVDDEDFERVSAFKWTAAERPNGRVYAYRNLYLEGGVHLSQLLHRFILGLPQGRVPQVDHQNADGLDNRKRNLRIATVTQNHANQRVQARPKTSRFKGVRWHKQRGYWVASIMVSKVSRHLGCFATEEDAARAYDQAAREVFGEFARTNFPE